MPIPLPNLDDRRFEDLLQEMRALIPRYAPEWTDHNVSDPGVTLIELFAWLAEMHIYRLNRIAADSEVRHLELLGVVFQSARPAEVQITIRAEGLSGTFIIPRHSPLTGIADQGTKAIPFETLQDIVLTTDQPEATGQARQTAFIKEEHLGTSDGGAHQTFPMSRHFVVLKCDDQIGIIPGVMVDGMLWQAQPDLLDSKPEDRHVTFDPRLNAVRFGNGRPQEKIGLGMIPPQGAEIKAGYRWSLGAQGNVLQGTAFRFNTQSDSMDANIIEAIHSGIAYSIFNAEDAAGGADPTDLDEARYRAISLLKTRHRAITVEDFETVILENPQLSIARAKCVPERDLTQPYQNTQQPSHVSVIVIAEPVITRRHVSAITILRFSPDGNRLAATSGKQLILIWNLNGRENVTDLLTPTSVNNILFSPDGRLLAAVCADNTVALWDCNDGTPLHVLPHDDAIKAAVFSPDGQQVATAGTADIARIWQTTSGTLRHVLAHDAGVNNLSFSPDGSMLATAGDDMRAHVWNTLSGEELAAFIHDSPVRHVVFSPDSKLMLMAAAGDDTYVRIWEADSGIQNAALEHPAPVEALSFSPNGERLTTLSADGCSRVWQVATGELLATLEITQPISQIVLDSGGKFLATVGLGNIVHVWEIQTGREQCVFYHDHSVAALSLNADGGRLATGGRDGVISIWQTHYLQGIKAFLDERRLITCRAHVVNPAFAEVRVNADVISFSEIESNTVLTDIKENLRNFFHPLTGGPETGANGWPFGRNVYASEVYQVIEGTEGVDHVEALMLESRSAEDVWIEMGAEIDIAPQRLVYFNFTESRIHVMPIR